MSDYITVFSNRTGRVWTDKTAEAVMAGVVATYPHVSDVPIEEMQRARKIADGGKYGDFLACQKNDRVIFMFNKLVDFEDFTDKMKEEVEITSDAVVE